VDRSWSLDKTQRRAVVQSSASAWHVGGAFMPPPGVRRPQLLDVPAACSWESYFSDHRKLRNLLDERSGRERPTERTE
jgi:hypothetical protein